MRRLLTGLTVAVFAASASAVPQMDPPAREIEKLLHDQAAAWTRGDLDAVCAIYADDATFISPSGLTSGRQAVLDRYRKKYVDKAGMGTLRLDVLEVRRLNAGAVSAVARWTLSRSWRETSSDRRRAAGCGSRRADRLEQ